MRNARLWLVLSLAVAVMAALTPGVLAGGDAEAGQALYAKKCATCHGKNGEGNDKIAKMLKVELRDLGSKEVQAQSDEKLAKFITEGTDKKKPVKGLSEEEVANVIAYVRSLHKK